MPYEFENTGRGRIFYDSTMPKIARNLSRIADALESNGTAAKEDPAEKWILVRMGPFTERGSYDFDVVRGKERYYSSEEECRGAMERDISKYISAKTDFYVSNFEHAGMAAKAEGYNLQWGDIAAELYHGDKYIQVWRMMRIA